MNKEEESDLNIETQSNRTESQLKPIYSELVSWKAYCYMQPLYSICAKNACVKNTTDLFC